MMRVPERIAPRFVERVWGRTDLSPLFGPQEKRIGEVWFPIGDDFPLLVKFIFTSERLSVQVHPDDTYARLHENSRGKTEMWHILYAEPGAQIALGLREQVAGERLRAAVLNGSIEQLLNWIPVQPRDTIFTPAGVIHAIGAGVVLCEIQQNSDVTYRLYDYGRPRQLHLEKGLAVCDAGPYDGRREMPVCCEQFTTEVLDLKGPESYDVDREHLLITLEGHGTIADKSFAAGEAWRVPESAGTIDIRPEESARLLRVRWNGW